MTELTPIQQKVFDFIQSFAQKSGYPPTIREIAAKFGFKSVNGVAQHLRLISQKGFLSLTKGRARGIELTRTNILSMPAAEYSIGVLGTIAAGVPLSTQLQQDLQERVSIDRSYFKQGNLFGLRVKGDSMIEAGILSGDIAIIREQPSAYNGDIVAAVMESADDGAEATLKRFIKDKNQIILHPENSSYSDIVVPPDTKIWIAGKMVGLIRSYK